MKRSGWPPCWAIRSRVKIALRMLPSLMWPIRRLVSGSEVLDCLMDDGDNDDGTFWW